MASELTVQTLKGPTSGANANKIIVPSGHTLAAAGHVIQVVQNHIYTQVANTTTSFIDTGIEATITPSSTSSLILISAFTSSGKSATNTWAGYRFTRNGTSLDYLTDFVGWDNTANYAVDNVSFQQLDNPNTISAVTYKLQFSNETGTGTVYTPLDSGSTYERARGQIILMEIAQ